MWRLLKETNGIPNALQVVSVTVPPTRCIGKLRKLKFFPYYVENELKYLKPRGKQQIQYMLLSKIERLRRFYQ